MGMRLSHGSPPGTKAHRSARDVSLAERLSGAGRGSQRPHPILPGPPRAAGAGQRDPPGPRPFLRPREAWECPPPFEQRLVLDTPPLLIKGRAEAGFTVKPRLIFLTQKSGFFVRNDTRSILRGKYPRLFLWHRNGQKIFPWPRSV